MTDILDLDALGDTIVKSIVYKTETHHFAPMTVDDFIAMVRLAEEEGKEGQDDDSFARRLSVIRDSVGKAFPTLAPHLGAMPAGHLTRIFEFLQRTADGDLKQAADTYKSEADAEGNAPAQEGTPS